MMAVNSESVRAEGTNFIKSKEAFRACVYFYASKLSSSQLSSEADSFSRKLPF